MSSVASIVVGLVTGDGLYDVVRVPGPSVGSVLAPVVSQVLGPVLAAISAVVYGTVSAFVPIANAEVYAGVSAARDSFALAVITAVALALGQTVGKIAIFEAARRGSARFASKRPSRKWAVRITAALSNRRTALPVVLTSALVGLPPLAAVSCAAGAAGQSRRDFAVACLLGRSARFLAVAAPLAWAAA